MAWLRRLVELVAGPGVPPGFTGTLDAEERVLAVAGDLVATSLGLWLPEGDGVRRAGWHLISKATWGNGTLTVTEAAERGAAGEAVLLADLPARRFALERPGRLPAVVHARVTGSIRSRHRRELPGGGVWFVQRVVPGVGIVLQVRADPGTDPDAVRTLASEVAEKLRVARDGPVG
ncbi:MAG TPA: hypothetical protein VGX25_24615 [Actinophytocola sp.]|uniref:hypothetical protein n=1 Tax=Actinophytocola sp. TaxID=1872138 RepID=UPI002DDCA04B|nr:hypothetical protein [Actinophytocola sp.]HEV2782590.1 hypothetical protein [Actinophytocola sp.]